MLYDLTFRTIMMLICLGLAIYDLSIGQPVPALILALVTLGWIWLVVHTLRKMENY